MKWLTLEFIKAHSRIDFDCDDELLTLYGDAAEQTVLNYLNRTYDETLEAFGITETTTDAEGNTTETKVMPATLTQAALMLVDNSYQQRSPASAQSLYSVPYTFDALVKPYMKLT